MGISQDWYWSWWFVCLRSVSVRSLAISGRGWREFNTGHVQEFLMPQHWKPFYDLFVFRKEEIINMEIHMLAYHQQHSFMFAFVLITCELSRTHNPLTNDKWFCSSDLDLLSYSHVSLSDPQWLENSRFFAIIFLTEWRFKRAFY